METISDTENNIQASELGGPTTSNARLQKLMGFKFFIDSRYELYDIVGSGAYGVVAAALDHKTGRKVAIKKMELPFQQYLCAKRTLRELKIMRLLRHENIVKLESIQLPNNIEDQDELYIVTELLETDLSSVIKSGQSLTDQHCGFFLYQILRGLRYMHSAHVVHRDLKPRNILVNEDCTLKICDFGLSRICHGYIQSAAKMTDYVATRWYRSPELLLRLNCYGFPMDIWALGCIFGELLLRKPLLPGNSSSNQLELIFRMLGRPSEDDIEIVENEELRRQLRSIPETPKAPLEKLLEFANPLAIDLITKMLVFNPAKRITVQEAFRHPYIAYLHSDLENDTPEPISEHLFTFEKRTLNLKIMKELVYEETLIYHSRRRQEEEECDRRTLQELAIDN